MRVEQQAILEQPAATPPIELSSEQSRVVLTQPSLYLVRHDRESLAQPATPEDLYRELETVALGMERNRSSEQKRFAIFLKNGGDLVGGIQLQPSIEAGIALLRSYSDEIFRHESYLADAIMLLREYAISTLGYLGVVYHLPGGSPSVAHALVSEGFQEVDQDKYGRVTFKFRIATPATPARESGMEGGMATPA